MNTPIHSVRTVLTGIGITLLVSLVGCPQPADDTEADSNTQAELDTERDTDADSDTDADTTPPCADEDDYEPNDDAVTATALTWTSEQSGAEYYAASAVVSDARLCSGNSDWFRVTPGDLTTDTLFIKVRAQARGADQCGSSCGGLALDAAPENTLSFALYDDVADSPLAERTQRAGIPGANADGDPAADDLLIRFFGPNEAEFPYRFSITVQDFEGEDECEC